MVEIAKEIGVVLFFAGFLVGIPAWCTWLVANGIRTGVVRAKGFPYVRHDSPIYFWITIAIYAALGIGIAYEALLVVLVTLRGG